MPIPARVLLTASFVALATTAPPVAARIESPSAYTKAQTYNCVLRYLRVDRGYEIVEKDAEAAYVLFNYPVPGQKKAAASGAMEIIDTPGGVKLVVQLPRLPSYHETLLRDGLLRKLRDEYGPPPPKSPPPPAKPAPPEDGSAPKKPESPKENGEE